MTFVYQVLVTLPTNFTVTYKAIQNKCSSGTLRQSIENGWQY